MTEIGYLATSMASALIAFGFAAFMFGCYLTNGRIRSTHTYLKWFGILATLNGLQIIGHLTLGYMHPVMAYGRILIIPLYWTVKLKAAESWGGRPLRWHLWAVWLAIGTLAYVLWAFGVVPSIGILNVWTLVAISTDIAILYALWSTTNKTVFTVTAVGFLLWSGAETLAVIPFVNGAWAVMVRPMMGMLGKIAALFGITWAHWERLHAELYQHTQELEQASLITTRFLEAENERRSARLAAYGRGVRVAESSGAGGPGITPRGIGASVGYRASLYRAGAGRAGEASYRAGTIGTLRLALRGREIAQHQARPVDSQDCGDAAAAA